MGYPAELLDMSFEPEKFSRGLVLDKQLGNDLKIDRYKYVRKWAALRFTSNK